jgi:hypothetical protein
MVSLPIRQDLSAAELRDLARKESNARVSRRLLGEQQKPWGTG